LDNSFLGTFTDEFFDDLEPYAQLLFPRVAWGVLLTPQVARTAADFSRRVFPLEPWFDSSFSIGKSYVCIDICAFPPLPDL